MEEKLTTMSIIPGISGYVSKPTTYNVQYLNGLQTYTEKFAVINIGAEYTGDASKQIDQIIGEAAAALTTVGTSIAGPLGAALGPLASIALHWIKDQVFNSDGSITILLAYHNIGTKNIGIDPTFWPGGLPPTVWNGIVNSVSVALSLLGSKFDNQESLNLNFVQQTKGNYCETIAKPAIELVKDFYANNNKLETMHSTGVVEISNENRINFGMPLLSNPEEFSSFLNESLNAIKLSSSENNISTFMINCTACKTVAYSAGAALVAMGGIIAAELTIGSSVVIALASYLGVSVSLALGYIMAAIASIEYGVTAVVGEICSASGCC